MVLNIDNGRSFSTDDGRIDDGRILRCPLCYDIIVGLLVINNSIATDHEQ